MATSPVRKSWSILRHSTPKIVQPTSLSIVSLLAKNLLSDNTAAREGIPIAAERDGLRKSISRGSTCRCGLKQLHALLTKASTYISHMLYLAYRTAGGVSASFGSASSDCPACAHRARLHRRWLRYRAAAPRRSCRQTVPGNRSFHTASRAGRCPRSSTVPSRPVC